MKILLFGGSGQLGYELKTRARDLDFEIIFPVTSEVNVTELDQVMRLTGTVKPTVIINCAAYTAVDKAEEEKDLAFKINRDGAEVVAKAAAAAGARMVHISTDYVFDGLLGRALREDDPVNPKSVYGASKLAGEQAVLEVLGKAGLVLRTSSLHGQKGINFVHTMIKLFQEREVVRVVSDQIMSPTWAGWLAETILDLVRIECDGVFHASCRGQCSWFEFASEIHRLVAPKLGDKLIAKVEPMTALELNRPATRPVFSAFNTDKLSILLGRPPIPWQEGLANHLRDIEMALK